MNHDLAHLRQWIGRTDEATDTLTPAPANLLAATLDRDDPPYKLGDPLPPAWHWIYFLKAVRPGELGRDGHPALGGFMPPIGLARRMWAGGRLTFLRPLRLGETATQTIEIGSIDIKEGRAGKLVFVTLRCTMTGKKGPAVVEEKYIVYRGATAQSEAAASDETGPVAPWQRAIHPDPVLLFRYSALTFNGHRIHYDHPYVTEVEGYRGLIVHGPLIATLLLDLIRREKPRAKVLEFSFRAKRPLFDTAPFSLRGWPADDGKSVRLMAVGPTGAAAVEASAVLA